MDAWTRELNSWDICDSACGNLFVFSPHAWDKIAPWAADEMEFVRRAGYVLLACLAVHDKSAPDQAFLNTFPIIKAGVTDPRNFVKKAVNWALRAVGKCNLALNKAAVAFSEELIALEDKTASWIARDAIRELTSEKVQTRLRHKEKNNRI
jgi:3-methyladenine DNA glycosylase AlkD